MRIDPATTIIVGDFVEFIHPVRGSINVQEVIKVVKKRRTHRIQITVEDAAGRRLRIKHGDIIKVVLKIEVLE